MNDILLFAAAAVAAAVILFAIAGYSMRARSVGGLLPGCLRIVIKGSVILAVIFVAIYVPNLLSATRNVGVFGLSPIVPAAIVAAIIAGAMISLLIGYVLHDAIPRGKKDESGADRLLSRMYQGNGGWREPSYAATPSPQKTAAPSRKNFGMRNGS